MIEKSAGRTRKILFLISVLINIGALFFFKYFNFFNENIIALADLLRWNYPIKFLAIALPIGLSFHIFQSLSYVIEVYKGKYRAEKNFLTYALYIMFFPRLVAGPIERPQNLLPQFRLKHDFNARNVRRGLERMLWGFFKKLVIADQIAVIVNHLYSDLPLDSPALVFLIILFSYQLYCDFSGYTDIALGSAAVLGYDLTENFNRPYAARSIAEFWRRWHISLSSWLRDYVYYPLALGWGKISKARLYLSLFITFVLIGLWHGANWTFIVMGAMHGVYIIIGSATQKIRRRVTETIGLAKFPKLHHAFQVVFVFILVSLGAVFFRAKNINQAWQVVSRLGNNVGKFFDFEYLRYGLFTGQAIGATKSTVALIILLVVVMEIVQYYQAKQKSLYIFDGRSKVLRYGWYYLLILTILWFGYSGAQAFIYFKF